MLLEQLPWLSLHRLNRGLVFFFHTRHLAGEAIVLGHEPGIFRPRGLKRSFGLLKLLGKRCIFGFAGR